MNFIKQVKTEIINLLKLKFILIFGSLVLLFSIGSPIIGQIFGTVTGGDMGGAMEMAYYESGYDDPITVDGVTIEPDNPFYWDIRHIGVEVFEYAEFEDAEAQRYFEEFQEKYLAYYLKYAQEITSHEDYRMQVVWNGSQYVTELFVLESNATNLEHLNTAIGMLSYVENMVELLELDEQQKTERIAELQARLNDIDRAVSEDDFAVFVEVMIGTEESNIEAYEEQIAIQEAAIVENPDLEESGSKEIEYLNSEIAVIRDYKIPTWEYRLEHNIIPSEERWENIALVEIENMMYSLAYNKPVSEEEFKADTYLQNSHGTYRDYVATIEAQNQGHQRNLMIAQNSLDAGEPDMKFVEGGARNAVNNALGYSLIVAVFAILVGGYIMASEFQSGTIRLLMIRPRTRIKVYLSKFLAGFVITSALFLIGMLLNFLLNGILLGFADYGYPNYSASGPINFLGLIIGRILASLVTVIFSYSVAFGLSALIRNAAVAIAIPSAIILGGMVALPLVAYTPIAVLLPFTPLPYLNISDFFSRYGTIPSLIDRGVALNLVAGIIMILIISILISGWGLLSFKNRDITN